MTSMIVLEICTAYEQGYGHGYDKRDLCNPYPKGNGKEAWEYGYSEGLRKRSSDDEIREEVRAIEHNREMKQSRDKLYAAHAIDWTKKPRWADVWIEHYFSPGSRNYTGWYKSLDERFWTTKCGNTAIDKSSDKIKAHYPPWEIK